MAVKAQISHTLGGAGMTGYAKDYPIDNATNTPSKGDFVKLVNGKLQKSAPADITILGLMDGANFEGIGQTVTTGKVTLEKSLVYRVPYVTGTKTTLTDADLGTTFDLATGSAYKIALDQPGSPVGHFKLVKYDNVNKIAYVTINKPAL